MEIVVKHARHDEIWFGSGNRHVRFGKQEFCLVTVLAFGEIHVHVINKYHHINDVIHERYFQSRSTHVDRLVARFQQCNFQRSGDPIRLALALFVSLFFIGQDSRRSIPFWLWWYVEDLPRYNSFPWGSYIYSMTLYYCQRAFKHRGDWGYNLYGFP
ncbi:hypothetical protein Dsin_029475 [Dipteronia sinensis]|uniref:DUF1985 domain-containing protein n=1 Tax=Dipteronia sinensis TaxID=43782 RepID=A0AAD9ZT58_9ROSI|nr:hypothetical protein Dsin_029475 [Dipteronia sinensis]